MDHSELFYIYNWKDKFAIQQDGNLMKVVAIMKSEDQLKYIKFDTQIWTKCS